MFVPANPWLDPTEWSHQDWSLIAEFGVALGTLALAGVTLWLVLETKGNRLEQGEQIKAQLALQEQQMSALQAPYVHPLPSRSSPRPQYEGPVGSWDFTGSDGIGARNDGKGVAWDIRAAVRWPNARDGQGDERVYGPFTLGVGNEADVRGYGGLSPYGFDYTVFGHFVYRDGLHGRWVTRFRFAGGSMGPLQCVVWSYEHAPGEDDVPLVPPPA